jgi:hypothetical protein
MKEKLKVLKADLSAVRGSIESVYANLDLYRNRDWDGERTILVAYHLHNLYCAFEDAFQRVAETFENDVPDKNQWHAQLLHRMTLDIEGVRPRVLSDRSADCLDELRRFRHLFRSAYALSLDPGRLRLVWDKAADLRRSYPGDLDRFLDYVDQLCR